MASLNESRIDHVVYFAPLHALLSINKVWRRACDPSSWIADFYKKEREKELSSDDERIVVSCKRIEKVLLALQSLRPSNTPTWYGKDIVRLLKLAAPLKDRLQHLNLCDDMLNEFLSMLTVFNELRKNCFKSVLGDRWRESIKSFKDNFIPYTIKQAGTGNIYHHLIAAHLEAILEANQPHGLNSLASDQSIEAAHHIVKKIGEPLGLPLNQVNPSQEGTAQQQWENMNRKVLARFNGEAFSANEFKDIKTTDRILTLTVTDEQLIAAFTTD